MSTKKQQPHDYKGLPKKIADILRFEFEGLPCVDATETFRMIVNKADTIGAIPKHPTKCKLAKICYKCLGDVKVRFWRSVAYIQLPDENGNPRVERFSVAGAARKIVEAFDEGRDDDIPDNATVTLTPPRPSMRIGYRSTPQMKARLKKYRQTLQAKKKSGKKINGQKFRTPIALQTVRNGSGSVRIARLG